jgi:hypothetical protein
MITKSLFVVLFTTAVPVFADRLEIGAVYFDSVQTFNQVIKLSAQHDNEGIARLIETGHIKKQIGDEMDIVVLTTGSTPESPAEFHFVDGPTTYWTVTKNITGGAKALSTATPAPTPVSASTPHPTPAESPTSIIKNHRSQNESDVPLDDDHGRRIWHQVDGKWKWYPAKRQHVPVKKAAPPGEVPMVKP